MISQKLSDGLTTAGQCVTCGVFLLPDVFHDHSKDDKQSAFDHEVAGTHYRDLAIQAVEFIHKNGLGFLEGCVIKRMCRWRKKDGIQDLEKAIHEIQLLIETEKQP